MEILFKNSYTRTKDVAKEFYRYMLFGRASCIVLHVALVVLFLEGILYIALGHLEGIGLVTLVLALIALRIYAYFNAVKMMLKRDVESSGKEVDIELTVTDDHIFTVSSLKDETRLEYGSIKKVYQTKNLIHVRTKASLVYIFVKDSFTVGSKDDFIVFLKTAFL